MLTENQKNWLQSGEHGTSSETIFTHLTGHMLVNRRFGDIPCDPADLRRCRLLLEMCPELVPLFPKMAELSPQWKAMVDAWGDLCATMDQECPTWRTHGDASKTYRKMQKIRGVTA